MQTTPQLHDPRVSTKVPGTTGKVPTEQRRYAFTPTPLLPLREGRPDGAPGQGEGESPERSPRAGLPCLTAAFLAGLLLAGTAPALGAGGASAEGDWPQWAGPGRDYRVPPPLGFSYATEWSEEGPKRLWQRQLGLGYSSLAVVGGRIFAQDREGDQERVSALDASSGETLWTHTYDAPHLDGMRMRYGAGPHATPLVHGGRVFTTGATARLFALDADDGAVLWQKELWGELEGTFLVRGYAASPLLFTIGVGEGEGEVIILPVGSETKGFVAFDPATGEEKWASPPFRASQSSPILIEVGGEPQVVGFVNDELVAVDPRTGRELWRHEHESGAAYNISMPLYRDGVLTVSSAYGGGTRALRLASGDGSEAAVQELWHTNRMKVHYTNLLRFGDHVYGSTGNAGSILLAGVALETGKVSWKSRDVGRAQMVALDAEGLTLALSEDGELWLIRLTPAGPVLLASHQIADEKTWTLPVVLGDRLYVRNEKSLMAFELPTEAGGSLDEPAAESLGR